MSSALLKPGARCLNAIVDSIRRLSPRQHWVAATDGVLGGLARLPRSIAFRTGAYIALLNLLSLSLLATLLLIGVGERIERRVEAAVENRHATINRLFTERGEPGLADAVAYRLPVSVRYGAAFERLDANGAHVSGNVRGVVCAEHWQDRWVDTSDATYSVVVDPAKVSTADGSIERFRFLSRRFHNGCLSIGRSLYEHDTLVARSIGLLAWAIPVCLLPSLLVSVNVSRRIRLRVQRIGSSLSRVADGALAERLPVTRDDEIGRLAHDTNQMIERLQESVEALQQLSSTVAHDLRAPLARLAIPLERALVANRAGRTDVEALEDVISNTEEMKSTFDALLRISQIESGHRRAGFRPVCLIDLIETLCEIYAPVCEDAGMSLFSSSLIRPAESTIDGDPELIQQAVVNLLENAIHHCPHGTTVRVTTAKTHDSVELSVIDNGLGIPKVECSRVFRRLYRIEPRANVGGTGLGLSLVRAVTELHGATVSLHDADPGLQVRLLFRGSLQETDQIVR